MIRIFQVCILIIVLPFLGCENSDMSNPSPDKKVESEVNLDLLDTIKAIAQKQFSKEKIIEFGDSIISYFTTKTGDKIASYETTIDTVVKEDYTKYTIKVRTNTYKTNGLISYDIYTFPTKVEATEFFNELKTQELLVSFGLNKRPNHILVDSNRVFWHQLEHRYGHRMNELNGIFRTKFNFYPQSTNLDSVSGFTYCSCKNDDANIVAIKGKWKIGQSVVIRKNYSENEYNRSDCTNFMENFTEINLRKDSVTINGKSLPIQVTSSIKLPNNRLFWKYYFSEAYNTNYSDEFMSVMEKMKAHEHRLTLYDIKLTNHCSFSFIKLDNGKIFMIINNNFYTLHK
ncbi:MAG: hypothetical protein ACK4K0_05935 [Flavobacteriales bacterium]